MKIGTKTIESFSKPYIIAEIGANHNGNLETAKKMIEAAYESGADAVKFQTWTADSLYCGDALEKNPDLKKCLTDWSFSPDQFKILKQHCEKVGIHFSATPFSESETDFLADLHCPYIKIASMDINNYPFLKYCAAKKIPMIVSTGFGELSEIARAVETISAAGNRNIVLMHCVSDYPPSPENLNLFNIPYLEGMFGYQTGYSDHSLDILPCLTAVSLGAAVIERHFTLDKNMEGWDHQISSDPAEMKQLVEESARIVSMLGSFERNVTKEEQKKRIGMRRSIVSICDIEKGDKFGVHNIGLKRPGTGLPPEEYDVVCGLRASKRIGKGIIIKKNHL